MKYASEKILSEFGVDTVSNSSQELVDLYGLTTYQTSIISDLYYADTHWDVTFPEASLLYDENTDKYFISHTYFSNNSASNRWFTLNELLTQLHTSDGINQSEGVYEWVALSPSNTPASIINTATGYSTDAFVYIDPHDDNAKYLIKDTHNTEYYRWLREDELSSAGYKLDESNMPLKLTNIDHNYATNIAINKYGNIDASADYEYSLDNVNWQTMPSYIHINAGQSVYFRGTRGTQSSENYIQFYLGSDIPFSASGNINSLLSKENFASIDDLSDYGAFTFYRLFSGAKLVKAPNLPATTLASNCYKEMFSGCDLTNIPLLPATNLASGCYSYMFNNCTNLIEVPELIATILASECYFHMFDGCSNITRVLSLPATTLTSATDCYSYMFYNCSSLTEVNCNAITFTNNNTNNWLYGVANTGIFYGDDDAVWSSGPSGIPIGWSRPKVIGKTTTVEYGTEKLKSDYWWTYGFEMANNTNIWEPSSYSGVFSSFFSTVIQDTSFDSINSSSYISYLELLVTINQIDINYYSNTNINSVRLNDYNGKPEFYFTQEDNLTLNTSTRVIGTFGSKSAAIGETSFDLPSDLYTINNTTVIWNTAHPMYSILYGKQFVTQIESPIPVVRFETLNISDEPYMFESFSNPALKLNSTNCLKSNYPRGILFSVSDTFLNYDYSDLYLDYNTDEYLRVKSHGSSYYISIPNIQIAYITGKTYNTEEINIYRLDLTGTCKAYHDITNSKYFILDTNYLFNTWLSANELAAHGYSLTDPSPVQTYYTVTFYGPDNITSIRTESVLEGGSPTGPGWYPGEEHYNKIFNGWNSGWDNPVYLDRYVYGSWSNPTPTPTDWLVDVQLQSQWEQSYPGTDGIQDPGSEYTVFRSFSNYNVSGGTSSMLIETNLETEGTISFKIMPRGENNYDYPRVSIDGNYYHDDIDYFKVNQGDIWLDVTTDTLYPGYHSIIVEYIKDGSVDNDLDRTFVAILTSHISNINN